MYYIGPEEYIFISYSHKDESMVIPILKELKRHSIRFWYDHGIQRGSIWMQEIEQRIGKSSMVLAFVSENSNKSEDCRQELFWAVECKKTLYPCYLQRVKPAQGLGMYFAGKQALYAESRSALQIAKELREISFIKKCSSLAAIQAKTAINPQIQTQNSKSNASLHWISANEVIFGAINYRNQKNPIHWQVLEKKDDRVLLMSKEGLVAKAFHESSTPIVWKDCTLRKWLNYEFVNMVFSDQEKAQLCLIEVPGHAHLRYGTDGGPSTWDRVFVLSQLEAARYLPSDNDRKCLPSPLAIDQGTLINWRGAPGGAIWWLRTSSRDNTISYVLARGAFGSTYPDEKLVTVRPAVWVKL